MKNHSRFLSRLILVGSIAGLLGGRNVDAATWTGGSLLDGNWATAGNWAGGTIPGSTSLNDSTDVGTFDSAIANSWGESSTNPIVIDSGRNIGGLTFTGATGSYFIGSTSGNTLKLSSGGTIQILNTLSGYNAVQTINAPLSIQGNSGTYTFSNNSAYGMGSGAGTLNFGGTISGGASGASVLTLSGSNTNSNTISGVVSNGSATTMALVKEGTGTWVLSGANTFTGGTTINAGTLQIGSGSTTGSLSTSGTLTNNAKLVFNRSIDITQSTHFPSVIGGTGDVVQAGSAYLSLLGANTYTGTTTVYGGTISVNSANGTIRQSSGLVIGNNATFLVINSTSETAVNRVGDTATVTSYGGTINIQNTVGNSTVYAETMGVLTASKSHLNILLVNDQTGGNGNMQTLTLAGLNGGSTGTVTFLAAGNGLSSTRNVIRVSGVSASAAGQIIGPWATTGTSTGLPTDYAVYDGSGRILPSGIAATSESTWTTGANVGWTAGTSSTGTLTANRSVNSVRFTGASASQNGVALGVYNLETYGFLNANTLQQMAVTSSGGVIRQPGTAPANFYISCSNGVLVSARIQDNIGALTLVKNGRDRLNLSAASSFSGGLQFHAGTLNIGSARAIGTGPLSIYAGTTLDVSAGVPVTLATNNAVNIEGDFTFGGGASISLGTGAVSLGTSPGTSRTITANGTSSFLGFGGTISDGTTAKSLVHAGNGTLILAGSNAYSGSTSVTSSGTLMLTGANSYAGGTFLSGTSTLIARNASALGTGSLTAGSQTAFSYAAASDTALQIGGTVSLTGGTSSVLGGTIGSGATSAQITSQGIASATGAMKVNVYGTAFSGGTGTYTLLHGSSGSSLSNGTYSLNLVYNNTNFTVGAPTATATDVTVPITSVGTLSTAYWKGGLSGATQVWAASNGSTASNWGSDAAGAASAVVPGPSTDVIFSASTVTTAPSASTLGSDMSVKSITQQDTTNAVVLNADGYGLTVGTGGVTISSTTNTKALTLNSNLTLGSGQSWTNNQSGVTLTVNGAVSTGANVLTIAGVGPVTITGLISGSAGLAKSGAGTLTLNGVNTYTGDTSISSTGGITLGGVSSLGGGTYAGNITFSAAATLTHSSSADQTFSGILSGPGLLSKTGVGTLTITSNLAYTGSTAVSSGRLNLSGSNSAATGGMSITGGIVGFGSTSSINGTSRNVTVSGSGAVLFDAGFGASNIASTLLSRIVASSSGVIACDNYASTNFDFNAAGLSGAYLGAVDDQTFTGTLKPNGTAWRLGGSTGTLTMANPLTGSNYTLTVNGNLVLPAGNTFTGQTTINSTGSLRLGSGFASIGSTSIANNGLLVVTSSGDESFGTISGTGAFTKMGSGALTLSGPQYAGATTLTAGSLTFGSTAYSGPITVSGGTLTIANSDFAIRSNQSLWADAGTVNLGSGRQYLGSVLGQTGWYPGTGATITGTGPLTLNQANSGIFAGDFAAASGSTLVKTGQGTWTLTNPNSTTGKLSVIAGGLTLVDNGTLANIDTSGLTLNYSTLTIDNTGVQALSDRVRDGVPLTVRGATISFKGLGSTLSSETLGALSLAGGGSVVTSTPVNVSTSSADLIFAGSTGLDQANYATVSFTSGSGTLGGNGSGNPHIAFTINGVAATSANVISGGLVNKIIPWAVASGEFASYITYTTSASGNSGGIGALNTSGYLGYDVIQSTTLGNLSGTATQNVRATASSVVPSGGLNINALSLSGNTPVTFAGPSTDTLNLTSGGLIHSTGNAVSIGGSVDSGQITAGGSNPGAAKPLYIFNEQSTLTINSRVVNNPDGSAVTLVLSTGASGGTFTLTDPSNSYTGGTVINRATVTLGGTASSVGATSAVIPYSSAGVVLNNATMTVSTNAQQIASGNIVTLNGGSVLQLTGSTTLAGIVFNSNGGSTTPAVSTGTTLTLTGGITSNPSNVGVTPTISVTNLDLNGQTAASINVSALRRATWPTTVPTAPASTDWLSMV